MNNLNLFPFMNKGILTETDDLNNVLKSGIDEISAPTTGVLNGKGIKYGILVMFSASQRIQLLGNGLYGNAYFRTGRDNGTWYDWVSIYWHKIYSKRDLGELIGTATADKNGLMSKIFVVTDIGRGKGLIIDYEADSNGLYTSSSLIEIYIYSGANTAFYRVMSIPIGDKNIEIKYMGKNWCDFKYEICKLYVLPKSDDSSISYKVSLVRRTRPIFSTIEFSNFSSITGEIITPTPD